MKKLIKVFLFLLIATAILVLFYLKINPKRLSKVNVLFIVLDAARADHFSCYGYEKNTTPNIDAIASKGAMFLNNFTQATYTQRSVPQIFFSRYYSKPVFVDHSGRYLKTNFQVEAPWTIFNSYDDEQIILPEVLSLNGYRTVLFTEHPLLASPSDYFGRKFDEVYYNSCYESYSLDNTSLEKFDDLKPVSGVISWLEKNKEKSFFIYCHIMLPHIPYRVKKEDSEFLKSDMSAAVELVREKANVKQYGSLENWSEEDIRILKELYDSNLQYADKWIGILYSEFKKLDLEKNTLVIITSDHGENLGDHDSGKHGLFHGGPPWDSVTHVPLIMSFPPLIPAGIRIKALTESVGIMPSIIDICKLKFPKNKSMDGTSLMKFIKYPFLQGKRYIFSRNFIRSNEYKCILKLDDYKYLTEDVLIDLKNDPKEKQDISNENYEVKEKLRKIFEQKMRPYQLRQDKQKRNTVIDYPFCYLMSSFKISPKDSIGILDEPKFSSFLDKKDQINKPCILNTYLFDQYFAYLPEKGRLPQLTLSAKVPNGTYQVSILIRMFGNSYTKNQLGLKYRFDGNKPFTLPAQLNQAEEYDSVHPYYYLELGKTQVDKEKFSVEIEFNPPDKKIYAIYHIKFTPNESQEKNVIQKLDDAEQAKRLESLKALGYAQ
ncbi:MAG: sulfatase [Candidatus Omnitrophica bacterium]|nr:sulfatase [Candidatus Omnitrophota bacterium]